MTVKELIEILSKVPSYAAVAIHAPQGGDYKLGQNNVVVTTSEYVCIISVYR